MDEEIIRRNKFYKLLWNVNEEYKNCVISSIECEFSFSEFVEANYGIVIHYDKQGNITSDYEVSDEPKYTFCLLKHG